MPNDKQKKGTAAELVVAHHFVNLGYHVFSPVVYQTGPIDLVAINDDGEILLLDAKCVSLRANETRIARVRSTLQKELGVQIAYVQDGGNGITFAPPGFQPLNLKTERKNDD